MAKWDPAYLKSRLAPWVRTGPPDTLVLARWLDDGGPEPYVATNYMVQAAAALEMTFAGHRDDGSCGGCSAETAPQDFLPCGLCGAPCGHAYCCRTYDNEPCAAAECPCISFG